MIMLELLAFRLGLLLSQTAAAAQVWTFHGLSRVLTSRRLFQQDADIQVEGCMLLASVGELLYNNGYATAVFKLLQTGIRKHTGRVLRWIHSAW